MKGAEAGEIEYVCVMIGRCSIVSCFAVHLIAVIRPTTELHDAGLFVKREILYIDFARRFVDRRRFPFDEAVVVHRGLRRQRHFKVAVRTANSIITIVPFHSSFIHFNYRRFLKI